MIIKLRRTISPFSLFSFVKKKSLRVFIIYLIELTKVMLKIGEIYSSIKIHSIRNDQKVR